MLRQDGIAPAKHRATDTTGDSDTDQGQAAQRNLAAAAISEEEEPEDPATGGQDDAHGRTPPRATRAQLDTMRAKQERDEERQIGNLQRQGDTEEPLRKIIVVYYCSLPGRGKTSGRQGHGDRRAERRT